MFLKSHRSVYNFAITFFFLFDSNDLRDFKTAVTRNVRYYFPKSVGPKKYVYKSEKYTRKWYGLEMVMFFCSYSLTGQAKLIVPLGGGSVMQEPDTMSSSCLSTFAM
jgi:hypothetical protein